MFLIFASEEKKIIDIISMSKLSVLLIILLFFPRITHAQDAEPITLRAYYMATFKSCEEEQDFTQDEKILDIGQSKSCFYSRWFRVRQQIADSIAAQGGTYDDVLFAMGDNPTPKQFYAVYKNYPQKGQLVYTDRNLKDFVYTEPLEKQTWKLAPADSTILGYPCQAATCSFRGRNWHVYYTTEIPISDGPWKLQGLPGLILYAEDESGIFTFECIELRNGINETLPVPRMKSYIKCTRQELMDLKKESWNNPEAYAKKFGMWYGEAMGSDGKPVKYKPKTALFLDY